MRANTLDRRTRPVGWRPKQDTSHCCMVVDAPRQTHRDKRSRLRLTRSCHTAPRQPGDHLFAQKLVLTQANPWQRFRQPARAPVESFHLFIKANCCDAYQVGQFRRRDDWPERLGSLDYRHLERRAAIGVITAQIHNRHCITSLHFYQDKKTVDRGLRPHSVVSSAISYVYRWLLFK